MNNHAMYAKRAIDIARVKARELWEKQRRFEESDSETDTEDDEETPIAEPITKVQQLIHNT